MRQFGNAMINRYPLWKYILIVVLILVGTIYALPNLFGDNPALQISAGRMTTMDTGVRDKVLKVLDDNKYAYKSYQLDENGMLVRFANTDIQLKAYQPVRDALGTNYTVALNLAPATPGWLKSFNALPMYLGLDLRGGVHFLLEVDMDAAMQQAVERYVSDLPAAMREEKVRYLTVADRDGKVEIRFRDAAERDKAAKVLHEQYRALVLTEEEKDGTYFLYAAISEQEAREIKSFAIKQNITTLRNRVNELGVAEPVIQQQGDSRIVVQLPGVQDTARAKEILGATATLEYHMADEQHSLADAKNGRVPPGSRLYNERNGGQVLLQKQVIITGDQIIDAASGLDSRSGSPMVTVTLDSKGAHKMLNNTKANVGKRMAVVFIENKSETVMVDGKPVRRDRRVEDRLEHRA